MMCDLDVRGTCYVRVNACPTNVGALVNRRSAEKKPRSTLRTHHEPILDSTPLGRPVVRAQRRIRHLLPSALHGRLAPHIDDRLDVPPVVRTANKVPQGIVFSGGVFGPVGGKGGEEMGVRVDDRGRCCDGVGVSGEGEV
jgi:hypothetical protein